MRSVSPLPVIVQPNAGLPETGPDGKASYPFTAEMMLPHMRAILDAGASAIGGCCGTTPEHIALFSQLLPGRTPPTPACAEVEYICSPRRYAPVQGVADALTEIEDPEDLYDLEPDEFPLLDLTGLSPAEAAALVDEAQAICAAPLCFRASDEEALAAALRAYTGVAGVDAAGCDAAIALYGAKRL